MTTNASPAKVRLTDGLGPGAGARRLAEAIDPLRRKAAPDHLTLGCAAQMLEVQAAEIERLRAELTLALAKQLDGIDAVRVPTDGFMGPNVEVEAPLTAQRSD